MRIAEKGIDVYGKFLIEEVKKFIEKKESKQFVSQYQACKRFGRSNVDRWKKSCKIKPHYRFGEKRIEYKMSELLKAAETQQDYEIK